MAQNFNQLTTTRTAQIWVGALSAIVFIVLISGHLISLRDRTLVASALQDANRFRQALASFEIDYGRFPADSVANPFQFVGELRDPNGRPYLKLPSDTEYISFSYVPAPDGDGYTIVIQARDRKNTPIVANPATVSAQPEG
ncbi:hypothetical protein KJZ99_07005 [bacterium]|nr:hypothetical protein [bacterium]